MENDEKKDFDTNVDDTVYDNSKLSGRIMNWVKAKWSWCKDHREIALFGLITLVGGLLGIADAHEKSEKKRKDHEKVYRTIYDRSPGNYVVSKKDIRPDQQEEINRRRKNGEDIYSICRDMNIKLKR